MAKKRRPYWEEPEIEDWDEDEEWEESGTRGDRQVLPFVVGLGLGLGFGCYPRRYCYPRYYGCRPRYYNCRPRYCYPRQNCYPRPCYPL